MSQQTDMSRTHGPPPVETTRCKKCSCHTCVYESPPHTCVRNMTREKGSTTNTSRLIRHDADKKTFMKNFTFYYSQSTSGSSQTEITPLTNVVSYYESL